jgi:hypothetical protein
MSGSLLDAITMERRGVPTAVVGAEKLAMTTGRGMAKLQGMPNFPVAIIHGEGLLQKEWMNEAKGGKTIAAFAPEAAAQIEAILLRGRVD